VLSDVDRSPARKILVPSSARTRCNPHVALWRCGSAAGRGSIRSEGIVFLI
jgi:hypothetical protein